MVSSKPRPREARRRISDIRADLRIRYALNVAYYSNVELADRDALAGACVVVIDVLRASTSIVEALESGAELIIPVGDIATASRLAPPGDRANAKKVLAGERRCCAVDGFDLGNSPREFTPARVRGKKVVLTTTNGTRAFAAAVKSSRVVVCAFSNLPAVAEAVRGEEHLAVVCCGSEGSIAAEDLLCGGMLLRALGEAYAESALNDAARLSLVLAEKHGENIEAFLRSTDHGRTLVELGFSDDVAFCARLGTTRRVPEYKDGSIV